MSNFHPLEVVGRDSGTQLQVDGNDYNSALQGLITNTALTLNGLTE